MERKLYDVIVVGAGPAGLSSAVYAQRAGKCVLVLEGKSHGGQIVNTPKVENYPGIREISGFEFANSLLAQARDLGAEVLYEKCTGIAREEAAAGGAASDSQTAGKAVFLVSTGRETYACHSVVLAAGAVNRTLGVDRETELTGKGVSYCATCDGAFFRGKDVAVVGGGNTALEDALFLSNYCRRVYLVHRRDKFRGEKKRELLLREKENVTFCLEQRVTSILGEEQVQGVTLCHVETGEETELAVEGLFIAVGQTPDTQAFTSLVEVDEGGYVVAGEDCRTNIHGIFAAGDCRTKNVRQLTTAVADGSVAALAACAFCEEG